MPEREAPTAKEIVVGVVIVVLAGIVLGVGKMVIGQGERLAALNAKIGQIEKRLDFLEAKTSSPFQQRSDTAAASGNMAKPDLLLGIIVEQQRKTIKESIGPEAFQSFTDEDLQRFKANRMTERIVADLRNDNRFLEVVLAIKAMKPAERQQLFKTAGKTYKPTWAKLGKISREGQTEAGQQAEMLIAQAIVNLAREWLQQPEEDIKKQMQ